MEFIFGSGQLFGVRQDVANSTPIRFAALQDVMWDISFDLKELYGQNQYALTAGRGKAKVTGKAKLGRLNALVFSSLFFGIALSSYVAAPAAPTTGTTAGGSLAATTYYVKITHAMQGGETQASAESTQAAAINTLLTVTAPASVPGGLGYNVYVSNTAGGGSGAETKQNTAPIAYGANWTEPTSGLIVGAAAPTVNTTGQNLVADAEAQTVPASPYQVTVANAAAFQDDLGVVYTSSLLPLTKVASAPATGQYAVSALGVYTFAAGDTAKAMQISYTYTGVAGNRIVITNQPMGTTPYFIGAFYGTFQGNQLVLRLNRCTAQKLALGTKLDDFAIPEIDLVAFDDGTGTIGTITLVE